jgi:hypothetical protein
LLLEAGFAFLQPGALLAELLLLATDFQAHALQPRPQGSDSGLLSLQGGGSLGHLPGGGFLLGFLLIEPLPLGRQLGLPVVELGDAFFQIAAVLLKLGQTLFHLGGSRFELLFPLLDRGLEAVKTGQVVAMLGLALFESYAIRFELLGASLIVAEARGQPLLELLLLGIELAALVVELKTCLAQLLGLTGESGPLLVLLTATGVRLASLGFQAAFVLLHFARSFFYRLLKPREAVAPFPVTVVELIANIRDFLAGGRQFLLLPAEFRCLCFQLARTQFRGRSVCWLRRLFFQTSLGKSGRRFALLLALARDLLATLVPNDAVAFQVGGLLGELSLLGVQFRGAGIQFQLMLLLPGADGLHFFLEARDRVLKLSSLGL